MSVPHHLHLNKRALVRVSPSSPYRYNTTMLFYRQPYVLHMSNNARSLALRRYENPQRAIRNGCLEILAAPEHQLHDPEFW